MLMIIIVTGYWNTGQDYTDSAVSDDAENVHGDILINGDYDGYYDGDVDDDNNYDGFDFDVDDFEDGGLRGLVEQIVRQYYLSGQCHSFLEEAVNIGLLSVPG